VGVHVDSEVRPLNQIRVTLDGTSSQLNPTNPAPLSLPVRFAIQLPAGTSDAHLDFEGLQGGNAVAAAPLDVHLGASGRADLSLTLQPIAAADLSSAQSDLAGVDFSGSDLSALPDSTVGPDLFGTYPITITYGGTGDGVVVIDGVACPKPCSVSHLAGSVTLDAIATTGSVLLAFTGSCTSNIASCSFNLAGPANIEVNFQDPKMVALRVVPVLLGSGTGSVSPIPAGASCGSNCWLYPVNTMVTLTESTSGVFLGWGGMNPSCKTAAVCQLTLLADTGVTAAFSDAPMNYAFVSSGYLSINSSTTLTTIDALCSGEATAAGLANPDSYKAWVSLAASPAPMRFTNVRGWVRADGLPFGDTAASFTTGGRPLYPLDINQNGALAYYPVWTGTNADGTVANNCGDWKSNTPGPTGLMGFSQAGSGTWTQSSDHGCGSQGALYCFETTYNNPLTLQPTPGARRAFVTTMTWTPPGSANGPADADAQCETAAAALGGRWRAYLNGRSTMSNGLIVLDQTGGPWARLDRVLLAPIASQTVLDSTSVQRLAPLDQLVDGTYGATNASAWSGTANANCDGWTSHSGLVTGTSLTIDMNDVFTTVACNQAAALFCLED
jgi:hypothetical protein